MSTFLGILIAVFAFGVMIFLHESGHYIAARLCKVKVLEFAVGMGPKIVSRTSKKTGIKYSLRALPIGGYTAIIEKMLAKSDIKLKSDFFKERDTYEKIADRIVFTGMIDEYYDYCYGELEYRSLRFEDKLLDTANFQGNAVVNYTEYEIPYTRIIEHKHFEFGTQDRTVITYEYPAAWHKGDEPYYPMNDDKNNALYAKYKALADKEDRVIFGGRLGQYKYFDMHQVVAEALTAAENELKG